MASISEWFVSQSKVGSVDSGVQPHCQCPWPSSQVLRSVSVEVVRRSTIDDYVIVSDNVGDSNTSDLVLIKSSQRNTLLFPKRNLGRDCSLLPPKSQGKLVKISFLNICRSYGGKANLTGIMRLAAPVSQLKTNAVREYLPLCLTCAPMHTDNPSVQSVGSSPAVYQPELE
ncbi:hypothetical protein ACRRTK_010502 [Alexandromys fortis]